MSDPDDRNPGGRNDRAYELQSIDRLVAVINNGDDGSDATKNYRALVSTLSDYVERYKGRHKGKLTLTIDFEATEKGVDLSLASAVKLPARPKNKDRYFVTAGGDRLTAQDPAKETLFPGANLGRQRPSAI